MEVFEMLTKDEIPQPSFLEKLKDKKASTKDELLQEWLANQIQTYETIRAPRVERDKVADAWIRNNYDELKKSRHWINSSKTMMVIMLLNLPRKRTEFRCTLPWGQDENVFRGQFLYDCVELIGEELVNEAWQTHLADATLDYGNRLISLAEKIERDNKLEYLKTQRLPPDEDPNAIESKLHIVFY